MLCRLAPKAPVIEIVFHSVVSLQILNFLHMRRFRFSSSPLLSECTLCIGSQRLLSTSFTPFEKVLSGGSVGSGTAAETGPRSFPLPFDPDPSKEDHPDEHVHDGSEKDAADELADRSALGDLGDEHACFSQILLFTKTKRHHNSSFEKSKTHQQKGPMRSTIPM